MDAIIHRLYSNNNMQLKKQISGTNLIACGYPLKQVETTNHKNREDFQSVILGFNNLFSFDNGSTALENRASAQKPPLQSSPKKNTLKS